MSENDLQNSFNSPQYETEEEKRLKATLLNKEVETDDNVAAIAGAAVKREWFLSRAVDGINTSIGPASGWRFDDKEFDPTTFTEEDSDEFLKDVPEELWEIYNEATTYDHARALKDKIIKPHLEAEKLLNRQGLATNIAARGLAGLLDPAMVPLILATEGAVAPVLFAKGAKAANAAKGAILGMSVDGGVQAALTASDPLGEGEDILYAGATGFLLGGIGGALQPGVKSLRRSLETREGVFERPVGGPVPTSVNLSDMDALTDADVMKAVGVDGQGKIRKAKFDKLRFSMTSKLMSSDNPWINYMGGKLAPDGVGIDTLGRGQGITVLEDAERLHMTWVSQFERANASGWKQYRSSGGKLSKAEFEVAVSRAIRGEDISDPSINLVATQARKVQEDILKQAKAAGVHGFEDILENANYLTRKPDWNKIAKLNQKHNFPGLGQKIVSGAIRAANPDLDTGIVEKISKRYVETLSNSAYGTQPLFNQGALTASAIRELFENSGLSEDAVERIVNRVVTKKEKGEGSKISQAKHRTLLDESYVHTLDDGSEVRFDEILENNSFRLINHYAKQMSGHIALARMGIKSKNDWKKYLTRAKDWDEANTGNATAFKDEADKLELIYRSITGQPLHEPKKVGKWLQMLRDYNFARVMNQTGFAQFAELGVALGEHGLPVLHQGVPMLSRMRKKLANGQFNDEFAQELDYFWSFGNDPIIMRADNVVAESGEIEEIAGKAHTLIRKAGRVTAFASGMAPLTTAFERMTAMAMVHNFAKMAGGKSVYNKRRLAALGINDKRTQELILDNFKNKVEVEGALSGGNIKGFNFQAWEPEARELFINAIYRGVHKSIQRNNIGDMAEWMTDDYAKTVLQFRTFVIGAYEKQLLRGVAMRDGRTMAAWLLSAGFASMSYYAQTHLRSIGRDDREQYLEENANMNKVLTSGLARSSFMTLLPGIVDTGMQVTGHDPLFAGSRASGQSQSLVGGIPTLGMLDGFYQGAETLGSHLNEDYQMTQSKLRALLKNGLWSNMVGVEQGINYLVGKSELPRY